MKCWFEISFGLFCVLYLYRNIDMLRLKFVLVFVVFVFYLRLMWNFCVLGVFFDRLMWLFFDKLIIWIFFVGIVVVLVVMLGCIWWFFCWWCLCCVMCVYLFVIVVWFFLCCMMIDDYMVVVIIVVLIRFVMIFGILNFMFRNMIVVSVLIV